MKKETIVIGLAVAILAGFVAGLVVRWPCTRPAAGSSSTELTNPVKGPEDALVRIIEISEFQCPYCRRSAEEVLPQVLKMYPGKVAVEFWHNPLDFHQMAKPAAIAATAAGRQGKFWEMHDALFKDQKSLGPDRFVQLAGNIGLDVERFKWDLEDPRLATFVEQNMAASAAIGIRGTPMFIVNGAVIRGAQPAEKFKEVLDVELPLAEAARKAGTPWEEFMTERAKANGAHESFVKLFVQKDFSSLPVAAAGEKKKPTVAPAEVDTTVWKVPVRSTEPTIGPADAPLTVVLFSEFQCPFCAKGTRLIERVLEDHPGKVRVVFKNFPLPFHQDAMLAAEAALAAHSQGRFWEMHDLLFANQRALSQESIEGYARKLGLDMDRFQADLASHVFAPVVEEQMEEGRSAGVQGTPNFFINGRVVKGAVPYESIKALVAEELVKGEKLLAEGVENPYAVLTADGKTFVPFEEEAATFDLADSPALGPDGAEIELVVFSDFECPYCERLASSLVEVQRLYGDRARLVFKQFPLPSHKLAGPAAEAALAAHAQGRFWEMHDKLFANRKALDKASLEGYATELGLDLERFRRELDEGTWKARIEADKVEGRNAGVRGTPSLFVNGRLYRGGSKDAGDLA
jgi:protein-disulfide isomerase